MKTNKNLHLIQTDKPSRLIYNDANQLCYQSNKSYKNDRKWMHRKKFNIYITSDEEIKDGDWYIHKQINYLRVSNSTAIPMDAKKIILTDNKDLIKDGVQPIPDEFLQWFVKNPCCEEVEIKCELIEKPPKSCAYYYHYKIVIPNLKPKQDLKEIFYDYTYRDYFLAKMKDDSLVVIFTAYGKSSPLQDEFENLIDINTIAREANSKEYYDYFTQRGVKPGALCSRWRNEFKPIHKVLESNNNYDPQPIIVTLGHSKRYPNGHGMAIYNYTFDFKNNSLLSKTKEESKQELERGITITHIGKQETFEEVDEYKKNLYFKKQVMNPYPVEGYSYTAYEKGFREGYEESNKWQTEQDKNKYSEKDMKQFAFECVANFLSNNDNQVEIKLVDVIIDRLNNQFEQFKNKKDESK
jgi:hypothetical protein